MEHVQSNIKLHSMSSNAPFESNVTILSHSRIMGNLTLKSIVCIISNTNSISCAHEFAAYSSALVTDRVMTFCVELFAIIGVGV